jgi:preprotein translocase subunit YajC
VLGATPGGAASLDVIFWLAVPGKPSFCGSSGIYNSKFLRRRKKGETKVTFASCSAFCNIDQLALAFQAPGGGISLVGSILPLILIMVIFYFLMILPAQRRQKKVTQMLGALKNGDKVITNGGIYGTIVGLEADAVQLRVAEQVKMKVARSAIAGLQAEPPKES